MRRAAVWAGLVAALLWSAVAQAQTRPPIGHSPPGPSGEIPVSDEMIVALLMQTERIVHKTASAGLVGRPAGDLRTTTVRLRDDLSSMLKRLEGYADRRGYTDDDSKKKVDAASADAENEFGQFLVSLRGLDNKEFPHVFLAVLHDFLGEMLMIAGGAQDLADDPALRAMLVDTGTRLAEHRSRVELLLMVQPPPPAPGGDVDVRQGPMFD